MSEAAPTDGFEALIWPVPGPVKAVRYTGLGKRTIGLAVSHDAKKTQKLSALPLSGQQRQSSEIQQGETDLESEACEDPSDVVDTRAETLESPGTQLS